MKRAVFLDRDGTINREVNYLSRLEQFELLSGVAEAIKTLNQAGWLVVVITNQSGIKRGLFTEETLHSIHNRMIQDLVRQDARLDGIYCCLHHPDDGCECRKPSPKLVQDAAADLGIDLAESWFVGDKALDIETGRRAGCRTALVLTGYGSRESAKAPQVDMVAKDIGTFVENILEGDQIK